VLSEAPTAEQEQYRPDFTRPNPAYFEFVDFVVDEAAKMGIRVAMVPTWGRYINGGEAYLGLRLRSTPLTTAAVAF
jgi:hypothetical protein